MTSTLQRLRRREVRQEASGTLLGPNGPPQSGPALSAAADLRPADGAEADLVLEEEVAERARHHRSALVGNNTQPCENRVQKRRTVISKEGVFRR